MIKVIIPAAVGVVVAAIAAWAQLRAARSAERATLAAAGVTPEADEAKIEIVDAAVLRRDDLEPQELRFLPDEEQGREGNDQIVLDVKLRNSGGRNVYATHLTVEFVDLRSNRSFLPDYPGNTFAIRREPSYGYRARREGEGPVRVQISQVIPPGDTDRFLLSVTASATFVFARARVTVGYDGGRVAQTHDDVPFLRSTPSWEPASLVQTELGRILAIPDAVTMWRQELMPMNVAARSCLDDYDEKMRDLASIFTETGRASEAAAVHASRTQLREVRQRLGLSS